MAIKKTNTIMTVIVFLFTILNNPLKGQAITIKSLDGINETINVRHDSDRDILSITTLKDVMHIKDCNRLKEARALNKYFVKVVYQVRGGSGIHLTRTLILTIKNHRLYQPMHITSLFKERYIDYSKEPASPTFDGSIFYEVKLKFPNTDYDQKIMASIISVEKSKDHAQIDHNKESKVILTFDKTENVLYSSKVNISKYFVYYDPKTQRENKRYFAGRFPLIKLGRYQYYYIQGEWYEKSGNNNLLKYSYK